MFRLISSVFMGWALGSNDSSNIFGTAVASRAMRYRTAILLCGIFVVAGAVIGGEEGIETYSGLTEQTLDTAFIASLCAAATVILMTLVKLPVSTSQAMVGAIIGVGLFQGTVNLEGLRKVALAWFGTPVGALALSIPLYLGIGRILNALPVNIFTRDRIIKIGLVLSGIYGSYALGANNVANVTGVYAAAGLLDLRVALVLGGGSIALGVVTYSRNVMMTVGRKLVSLDPFSAFITVLSEALVVHFYSLVGVPVSTSQAIIGAVLGIGILQGMQTIRWRTLLKIIFGWIGTPAIALGLAAAAAFITLG